MAHTNITVYGAYWCPDCRRSKKFLGERRRQRSHCDPGIFEEGVKRD